LTGQTNPGAEININDVISELEKFGVADEPMSIQDHFIHNWHNLQKHYIEIIGWERKEYEIRYVFQRESQRAAFLHWVNGKNVFNSKFQKFPPLTKSDELFETIAKILENAPPIVVNRNNIKGVLTHVGFDVAIEEEKPFLKNLFDFISQGLSEGEIISNIQHLKYKERYNVEKNGKSCAIDFEYNGAGFFGRVLPLESKCNSTEILDKVKAIVNRLKEADYVI
jgi:hypothetical protein